MKNPNPIYFLSVVLLFAGVTMQIFDWLVHRGDPALASLTLFVVAILLLELNREIR